MSYCVGERDQPRSSAAFDERRKGMLNKEALTRLNAPQYHFKFRVGNDPSHDWDRGWVKETKGGYPAVGEALSPIPYWIEPDNYLERCSSTPSSTGFRSKATRSPQITNRIICRDETGAEIYRDSSYGYCFDYYSRYTSFLRDMLGQVVYVTFDPPPYRISLRKSSRYLPALKRRAW